MSATVEQAKPQLVQVLERVAEILELDDGHQRLELVFDQGHLVRWWAHDGPNGAKVLSRYDGRAGRLFDQA
jgi:hypothetical protein